MYHEFQRLAANTDLQQLLSLYAEAEVAVPGQWHARVSELAGVEARSLARLHGELLAHEWIEQNTAQTLSAQGDMHRSCYRVTPAGLEAWKQVLTGLAAADDVIAGIANRKDSRRTLRNAKARAHRAGSKTK